MNTNSRNHSSTCPRVSIRALSFLIATIGICAPAAVWAQPAKVAVFATSTVNLTEGEVDAMAVLLGEAYSRGSKTVAVDLKQAKAAVAATKSLPEAATQLGAATYIQLRAARLDQKIVLATALVQQDGVVLHRAEMTAASLDDLEEVSSRLARALIRRISTAQSLTLEDVTETETQTPNQKATRKVMGIKTGIHLPFASGEDFGTGLSLQFDGRFEGKNYFLEIGAGALLSSSSDGGSSTSRSHGLNGVFAEIGGSYYLTHSLVSPYVGGGLSPRLMSASKTSGDETVKCAVYGQGGVMFFREARTRFYAELRVSQNILPYNMSQASYTYSSNSAPTSEKKNAYPTELALQVGIGW